MNKGQVTIEFLFSFMAYLVFLSAIMLVLNAYNNSAEKASGTFIYLAEMEGEARMADTFLIISRHNAVALDSEMEYRYGHLYSEKNPDVFLEVLDYENGFQSEPI